jgi:F-type H+-transporting ATPase subunit a
LGTPKNLYEKQSGFLISKFMIIEAIVAILLIAVFCAIAKRIRTGHVPRGRFWNLFESILVYLRDNVARAAIGGGHDAGHAHDDAHHGEHAAGKHDGGKHDGGREGAPKHHAPKSPYAEADRFVPLLWTVFFFILFCNLMGILPWVGAPTSAWGTTFALACVTLLTVFLAGFAKFGPLGYWVNQIPTIDLPIRFWPLRILVTYSFLWPLRLFIFAIEVIGLLIRHLVLSIRLLANMVAGHLVLLGILGLILGVAEASQGLFATVATISVLGTVALTFLELFVAFLQAYVFTFLSALFIGAAVHHH